MGNTQPRNPGLDVIRCTALICVVAVLDGVYSVTVKPLVDRYLSKTSR